MTQQDNAHKGKQQWNVIFLLDQTPPTKIMLLKRSPTKAFAPDMYTGIGGKQEENETILESAYRELQEEVGLSGILLHHFANVVIDTGHIISYFYAFYPFAEVPDCNEGTLEWVPVEHVLDKKLIPTAHHMLTEWTKRDYRIDQQWTLSAKEIGKENGMSLEEIVDNREGLHETFA